MLSKSESQESTKGFEDILPLLQTCYNFQSQMLKCANDNYFPNGVENVGIWNRNVEGIEIWRNEMQEGVWNNEGLEGEEDEMEKHGICRCPDKIGYLHCCKMRYLPPSMSSRHSQKEGLEIFGRERASLSKDRIESFASYQTLILW